MVRPGGTVMIHILAHSHLRQYMTPDAFRTDVEQRIRMHEGQWHHYYSADEIDAVLKSDLAARQPRIQAHGGSLYFSFSK